MRSGSGAEHDQAGERPGQVVARVDVERHAVAGVEGTAERQHRLLVEQRLEPDGRAEDDDAPAACSSACELARGCTSRTRWVVRFGAAARGRCGRTTADAP